MITKPDFEISTEAVKI